MEFESNYMAEIEPENYVKWKKAFEINQNLLFSCIEKMFVAEVGSHAIGFSYWNIMENHPHVFSIYVKKGFRKNGIGKQLLSFVEDDVQSNSYCEIFASTRTTNPAKTLFRRNGYDILRDEADWIFLRKPLTKNAFDTSP